MVKNVERQKLLQTLAKIARNCDAQVVRDDVCKNIYILSTHETKKPTAVFRKFVPFLTYMFCRPNKNVWS